MQPISLNHIAYPTWDSAETFHFYTEVLGCPLVAAIQSDRVTSSTEPTSFLHTFYKLSGGGCIAFFEVDNLPAARPDGVPSWIRHIALDVSSVAELETWRERLLQHGLDPVGVVDHEDTWQSLYVFDPNGIRIELTVQTRELDHTDREEGLESLRRWCDERRQALPERVA